MNSESLENWKSMTQNTKVMQFCRSNGANMGLTGAATVCEVISVHTPERKSRIGKRLIGFTPLMRMFDILRSATLAGMLCWLPSISLGQVVTLDEAIEATSRNHPIVKQFET